jgi:sortase (surface protein transpeptidase)
MDDYVIFITDVVHIVAYRITAIVTGSPDSVRVARRVADRTPGL